MPKLFTGPIKPLAVLPLLFGVILIAAIACGGTETVVQTVVVEKVVEKQVPGKTVVQTVLVEKPVTRVEKVVQTVVVEKKVAGETVKVVETVIVEKPVTKVQKVVETVIVEKPVTVTKVEKVVETVIVEKEVVVQKEVPVTVVAVATPTPTPVTAPKTVSKGTLTAAIGNVYFMNSSPRYCPACSVTARTGAVEFLLQAVRADDGSVAIAPELATEWTQSADGISYTDFKLRDDVQFHDGWGKMTAKDVAFSWNDANPNIVPESVHDTGGTIGTILNQVEIIDDYTVRFNWKQFNASSLLKFVTNFWEGIGILSKDLFDSVGADGMREQLIGTGPFKMIRWTQHEGAFLEAVKEHWRKVPFVEKVNILEVPEASTRKAMLETRQAQIAGDIPLKDWKSLFDKAFKEAPESKLGDASFTMAGNYWETELSDGRKFTSDKPGDLLFKPPLQDKPWIGDPADPVRHEKARKVRQAMAMAIDRQALVDVLTNGLGTVSYMPGIRNDDPVFKESWKIPYDPDAARALLAEAGYADGFDLEWWGGPAVATSDTIQEAVAAMWLKELNIRSTIDQQNYSSFRPTLVNRTNTKLLFSGGNAHEPATWPKDLSATSLSRPGGYNRAIEIPIFRETFEKMSTELDPQKLVKLVQDMFDWNREWMVWVGVYQAPSAAIYDPTAISSWKMAPEGKGVLGMMNSLENVKLRNP